MSHYNGILAIASGSMVRDVRRQVYLFENFGGTILGGMSLGTLTFVLSYNVLVLG